MPPKKKAKKMSDVDDDDPGDAFDPNVDVSNMPDKKRKKLEKNLRAWRAFIDFIFRHIAIITFKYNCFEREDLDAFMIALAKVEALRGKIKLKKGEEARISSFRVMREAADLLIEHQLYDDANRIRRFLDIAGRTRALGMIAGGFVKALKKGKARNIDNIRHYADYWKGFTARSYDFTQLQLKNADISSFTDLGQKYMFWPSAVRTAIYLAQKCLQLACDATGQTLISADVKMLKQHMQAAEFIVATRIEEELARKVDKSSKSFLIGNPLLTGSKSAMDWDIPDISEIDPDMIRPMPSTGMLLELPAECPKDGKGKKGKKGGGKKKKK